MMRHQTQRRVSQTKPHINVTPLIDVLLVLLIIFMVISPLRPSRFKALVPEEPPTDPWVDQNPKLLVVSIGSDLQLTLNQTAGLGSIHDPTRLVVELAQVFRLRGQNNVVRDNLIERPSMEQAERIEKTVFIRAPRSLNYGEVARLIDVVKGTGANPIGLQIDDLEQ
ncbi:MAG: biopolymer transporter ExbD [Acidobacteriota bacterium]|nr:biopolymer transporter ExbD [Acidobacteriota bacterium]